ncbi:ESF1 homolog [Limulus polyphemus]|uniref:ESF1 homolog n=1 Tax=Limulus polyphemus TaxID=6850 RepID=A0ABM1BFN4_LIMPO|nr:ESF1 homolog [Limulus polyphemus]XP_022248966.1 ESF1 homolog [Limulus polyphemus]XP_022248967.1 ESF1 homolog [Limulus polyphemus]XP_022248968.1 ESF1 homolog [Limulus polyphemus]XP_022248969.1 ESF1 homolog [Limulus polyphemus]XP_022248970.1 ESF1 homolog [Limulus polyphemus]XP_022248971.1 ESF1 homolog [Limulus polyphemus]
MDKQQKDERFANIDKDPRFRTVPRKEKKITIDKRFQSMFSDKRFKLKYMMDKRGRPLSHTSSEDLKKFYELSSSDSSESEDEKLKIKKRNKSRSIKKTVEKVSDEIDSVPETEIIKSSVKTKPQKTSTKNVEDNEIIYKSVSDESEEVDETSDENDEDLNKQLDFARGEGNVESSTTDDSSNGEESENEDFDHRWGELDADAPSAQEITRRLAVCNMDWDRIKAKDLMVLFTSFKPPEGTVISVKIYPSEFGLKRMVEEETRGPTELFGEKKENNDDEKNLEEMPERNKYYREKVRQYQLNRLKYFYAVVECDSPETASKLYEDLDGKEYENSAAQLDLRFIPDNVIFEQEPKSVSESLPELSSYKPDCFTTTALQQAKVQLTWDETDPNRSKALQEAFTKAEEDTDLQAYLASSSSESEEEGVPSKKPVETNEFKAKETVADQIAKYRSLLLEIDNEEKDKDQDVEMQITWEPGLKETAEGLVKKKKKEKELTPWEEYLDKRKKKKENVTKLNEKQQGTNDVTNEDQPFSDDEVPSDLDLESSYFKEEFLKSSDKDKVRKKKERRKKSNLEPEDGESKAQLELLTMDEDDKKHHFSLKKLLKDNEVPKKTKKMKKKGEIKKKSADDFQMDLEDPRFSALFTSHLYNVDPSDTHFKQTKGMDAVIQEKQKRRLEQDKGHQLSRLQNNKIAKTDISVSDSSIPLPNLVKSVKNKTQNFHFNRRKK